MEGIRSGGIFCEICEKCISPPRKRKNFCPDYFMICEECKPDVLTVNFCPNEESLKTYFKVKLQDIDELIKFLNAEKANHSMNE